MSRIWDLASEYSAPAQRMRMLCEWLDKNNDLHPDYAKHKEELKQLRDWLSGFRKKLKRSHLTLVRGIG